ncbi:MAG: DUF5906 domain-containing protein [Sphingomicrobium sp.]
MSTLDYEFFLAFGGDNRDNRPKVERVTIRRLAERWRIPDTRRGKMASAEYHALDKKVPEQKERRNHEKNGEYFVPAVFGVDGLRREENIQALTAFTLDFDSGRTTREIIARRLAGLTYIAYTSYSHLPTLQRWRVVLPYRQPIRRDQHPAVFAHLQRLFDGDLDKSCRTVGQIYYTPACPKDAVDGYEMFYEDGELFDPERLPAELEDDAADESAAPAAVDGDEVTEELARLKHALTFLSPDPRDLWIRVGMAIKHDLADAGLAAWLEWSQRSPKFVMADAVKQWQSMQPKQGDDAITLRSVYGLARKAGWKPEATTRIPAKIAELNLQHFVARYGGKVAVYCEMVDPVDGHMRADPLPAADFRLLYATEKVWGEDARGRPKLIPLGSYWLQHPARREYLGVVFAPGQDVPGYYNLWRGFAVQPIRGTWKRMRWHMCFVLCRGDRRLYRYLLNWMAYAVQHPDRPAEVAVVLRGGRGAGKGVFARSFGKLFGPHYLQITQPKHLTGNFNKHLESCVVLFVDEGFWAGDKQGEGVLKGLITEPKIAIERKFFDVVGANNCLHIIVASNSEWVVPAGSDERRFFVLEIDDSRKQDPTYFGPLYAEMEGGGAAAMLYDLQRRDLSRFDIRQVPQNTALGEQKMQSLEPFSKWWRDKLVAEEFSDGRPYGGTTSPWGRVPTEVVHADYVRALGKTGVSRKATGTELGMNLKKVLPPGTKLRTRRTLDGVQVPHYDFPPLDVCRAHFEQRMGLDGQIDWTDGGITERRPSTPS